MTKNQIDYWNLQETKRHNSVTEGETGRHNLAAEGETSRHNVVTERETERSNRAREGIDLGKLNESVRHNKVTESETNRHNVATEGIDLGKLNETQRHNQASERISGGQLSETVRHNIATENLGLGNLNLGYSQLDELSSHNRAQESVSRYSAISQAELNEARSALASVEAGWKSASSAAQIELNSSQRALIEGQLRKLSSEVKQLDQNMSWKTYDEILKGVDTISRVMSALDDAQRGIEGFLKQGDSEKKYSKYLDNLLEDIRNEN